VAGCDGVGLTDCGKGTAKPTTTPRSPAMSDSLTRNNMLLIAREVIVFIPNILSGVVL
jgi:hypothetical protein